MNPNSVPNKSKKTWRKHKSERIGIYYYYNVKTMESVWDKPIDYESDSELKEPYSGNTSSANTVVSPEHVGPQPEPISMNEAVLVNPQNKSDAADITCENTIQENTPEVKKSVTFAEKVSLNNLTPTGEVTSAVVEIEYNDSFHGLSENNKVNFSYLEDKEFFKLKKTIVNNNYRELRNVEPSNITTLPEHDLRIRLNRGSAMEDHRNECSNNYYKNNRTRMFRNNDQNRRHPSLQKRFNTNSFSHKSPKRNMATNRITNVSHLQQPQANSVDYNTRAMYKNNSNCTMTRNKYEEDAVGSSFLNNVMDTNRPYIHEPVIKFKTEDVFEYRPVSPTMPYIDTLNYLNNQINNNVRNNIVNLNATANTLPRNRVFKEESDSCNRSTGGTNSTLLQRRMERFQKNEPLDINKLQTRVKIPSTISTNRNIDECKVPSNSSNNNFTNRTSNYSSSTQLVNPLSETSRNASLNVNLFSNLACNVQSNPKNLLKRKNNDPPHYPEYGQFTNEFRSPEKRLNLSISKSSVCNENKSSKPNFVNYPSASLNNTEKLRSPPPKSSPGCDDNILRGVSITERSNNFGNVHRETRTERAVTDELNDIERKSVEPECELQIPRKVSNHLFDKQNAPADLMNTGMPILSHEYAVPPVEISLAQNNAPVSQPNIAQPLSYSTDLPPIIPARNNSILMQNITPPTRNLAADRMQRLRNKIEEERKHNEKSIKTLSDSDMDIENSVGNSTFENNNNEPQLTDIDKYVAMQEMEWEPIPEEIVLKDIVFVREKLQNDPILERSSSLTNVQYVGAPKHNDWYIVVDTNIFILDLEFVKELRDTKFKNLGYPILVIPYIVITELDYLKQRSHTSDELTTSKAARRAAAFLSESFSTEHPRVKAQSGRNQDKIITENCNDDSIVNCCLLLKNKSDIVILLSNDINLRNKCLLEGVLSFPKNEVIAGIKYKFYEKRCAKNMPISIIDSRPAKVTGLVENRTYMQGYENNESTPNSELFEQGSQNISLTDSAQKISLPDCMNKNLPHVENDPCLQDYTNNKISPILFEPDIQKVDLFSGFNTSSSSNINHVNKLILSPSKAYLESRRNSNETAINSNLYKQDVQTDYLSNEYMTKRNSVLDRLQKFTPQSKTFVEDYKSNEVPQSSQLNKRDIEKGNVSSDYMPGRTSVSDRLKKFTPQQSNTFVEDYKSNEMPQSSQLNKQDVQKGISSNDYMPRRTSVSDRSKKFTPQSQTFVEDYRSNEMPQSSQLNKQDVQTDNLSNDYMPRRTSVSDRSKKFTPQSKTFVEDYKSNEMLKSSQLNKQDAHKGILSNDYMPRRTSVSDRLKKLTPQSKTFVEDYKSNEIPQSQSSKLKKQDVQKGNLSNDSICKPVSSRLNLSDSRVESQTYGVYKRIDETSQISEQYKPNVSKVNINDSKHGASVSDRVNRSCPEVQLGKLNRVTGQSSDLCKQGAHNVVSNPKRRESVADRLKISEPLDNSAECPKTKKNDRTTDTVKRKLSFEGNEIEAKRNLSSTAFEQTDHQKLEEKTAVIQSVLSEVWSITNSFCCAVKERCTATDASSQLIKFVQDNFSQIMESVNELLKILTSVCSDSPNCIPDEYLKVLSLALSKFMTKHAAKNIIISVHDLASVFTAKKHLFNKAFAEFKEFNRILNIGLNILNSK